MPAGTGLKGDEDEDVDVNGVRVSRRRGGSGAPRTLRDTARVALEMVWRARTLMTLESVFINDITCDWPLGMVGGWCSIKRGGKVARKLGWPTVEEGGKTEGTACEHCSHISLGRGCCGDCGIGAGN